MTEGLLSPAAASDDQRSAFAKQKSRAPALPCRKFENMLENCPVSLVREMSLVKKTLDKSF